MMDSKKLIHWSDITAKRIIGQKGDKSEYVLASGITPSGTVHFGNFREVMTVALVAQALRDAGKKVRFIFSWDDYDTFRKVPKNMPKQEELEKFLFQPIVDTPDPFGQEESYARHHEVNFESQLKKIGIDVEFLYQAKKYRSKTYNGEIIKVLEARDKIRAILDEHRSAPLAKNWLPLSIYCSNCNTDKIKEIELDSDKSVKYECGKCSHQGEESLVSSDRLKLPWRLDWPMRWSFENVDFEPGGKDHSSQGGSYDTAKKIVKEVFGKEPPVYLQYDFVSIKGEGGKMSSSSGELITLDDVLNIYEPEMVRWIFASYKTNVDFSVGFDLDVIKTYEDFDRQERLAYGLEGGNEKKVDMAKRVMQLSQISSMPSNCPIQPSFRHLCNILQIHSGDISKAREVYADEIKTERDARRFSERSQRALFWLQNYAPEEFKFLVNEQAPKELVMSKGIQQYLSRLQDIFKEEWESFKTDKDLHERLYKELHELELEPQEVFTSLYQILISKEKGPKLAGFMRTIGKDRLLGLFDTL